MDAKGIAGILVSDLFHFRRWLVTSNVSWGMLPWEADLLAMSGSGYLTEVEIKISIADLKRDAGKRKWYCFVNYSDRIRDRWFAMPARVWAHKDAAAAVPEHAGVIAVDEVTLRATVIRRPRTNATAHKLTDAEQFQLARLCAMRHWSKLARDARKAMNAAREIERARSNSQWLPNPTEAR